MMLMFREAIEDLGPVEKDLTATDAHQTTALGNQRGKGKARNFRAVISGGQKVQTWEGEPEQADKQAPTPLKPRDEATAHAPFPHDPNFLSSLRDDQVPRFLGALTDQDNLEERQVRLSSLVATQNRLDPEKVESMRGAMRDGVANGATVDKPPVVARHNGRNYIIDGHHRLAAAQQNGETSANVRFINLTPRSNALKSLAFDLPSEGDDTDGWSVPIHVHKVDADRQLVFGWASMSEIGGQLVVDKQDDVIEPGELEDAAYEFVLHLQEIDEGDVFEFMGKRYAGHKSLLVHMGMVLGIEAETDTEKRGLGHMHEDIDVGRLVESVIVTAEKQAVWDKEARERGGAGVDFGCVGWWVGFKVDSPAVWKLIKSGDLPEFSIGGRALRLPA